MKDTFAASGTIIPPTDINGIDTVTVTITSVTEDYVVYTEDLNDFNPTVVNSKHKYTHAGKLIKARWAKLLPLRWISVKGLLL